MRWRLYKIRVTGYGLRVTGAEVLDIEFLLLGIEFFKTNKVHGR